MNLDHEWLLDGAKKDAQSITKDWQPASRELIDGVVLKEMRSVLTGYGHLTEMLRGEWLEGTTAQVDQIFVSTLNPDGLSAWHAHANTTDRLFVAAGQLHIVLYDARKGSPTAGLLNEFRIGVPRPALLLIPPQVWHGVHNAGAAPALLVNAVDQAYRYDSPDHWRLPHNSAAVPFRFRTQHPV